MTTNQAEQYFMKHATYQDRGVGNIYTGPFYCIRTPGGVYLHDADVADLRAKFDKAVGVK